MKALLVGLGVMGSKHLDVLLKNPVVTHVVTVDPNNSIADFSSLEEVFCTAHEFDFAVVATPTSSHEEVSIQLINKGIHVLLEKPIASSLASAKNICTLADKRDIKVCIGQIERFNPVIKSLKEQVQDHDIISAHFIRQSPSPIRVTDVGVSLDLSVHDLDLVEYLFAKPVVKTGRVITTKHSMYQLELAGGVSVGIVSSWLFPFKRRRVEVLTNKGLYEADLIDKSLYEYTCLDHSRHATRKVWIDNSDPLSSQLISFINYINGGTSGSLCTAAEAKGVLKWLLMPA